ncbi:uncharacterized protein BCR38DRAFT_489036 [Pseudomassariella vexata]|uniref:Zn(2)-C6 fungal-type domain-containing protein n=1 Tax=Pseudomassariella vexata TaxID=1141098 RepID=A0A1Y2DJI5_9PEZI|nr:uncharacterized protein BCR38DRAFT_489036 [Pseudomassariella vexata]ORY59304.1 hypothetical protein BCR38DRAFT_489036 [Pseudomassariella vexata]
MTSSASTGSSKPRRQEGPPNLQDLKATCDFCALSKVKCDRGRPRCQRCIRSELECRYSKKRRISKARQLFADPGSDGSGESASWASHWTQKPEIEGCDGGGPKETSTSQSPGGNVPVLSESAMFLELFNPSQMDIAADMDMSAIQPFASGNESVNDSSPNDFMLMFDNRQYPERDQIPSVTEKSMALTPLGVGFSLGEHAKDDLQLCQANRRGGHCIERLCVALESLHMPVSRCSRQGGDAQSPMNPSYGVDITLKISRNVIDIALETLSCSCANNSNILSILALIGKQVMDLYWNLSKEQSLFFRDGPCLSPDNFETSSNGQPEVASPASRLPIAIGGYVLDEEARKKVLLQVLELETAKMGPFF